MQYVLIHNNFVINGPRNWNARSFESTLEDDLENNFKLPLQKTDNDPIIVDSSTKILASELIYPGYNEKIQYLNGPFWNFDNNFATGTFQILPKDIDWVKGELSSIVASNRYNKEISGTKTTIQGLEVTIDTNRGSRDMFVQKFLLMDDTDTVQWKFPEGWLTLSKSELGQVVSVGTQYVQNCFEWENNKVLEINNCTTLEQLDQVVLTTE